MEWTTVLLIIALLVVVPVMRGWKVNTERSKIGRVAVKLPSQGLDDAVAQAIMAIGFRVESERGATTVFRQEMLAAFKQRGLPGLSERALVVTKTADGLLLVGPSGAIDKLLPFLGGVVLSKA